MTFSSEEFPKLECGNVGSIIVRRLYSLHQTRMAVNYGKPTGRELKGLVSYLESSYYVRNGVHFTGRLFFLIPLPFRPSYLNIRKF